MGNWVLASKSLGPSKLVLHASCLMPCCCSLRFFFYTSKQHKDTAARTHSNNNSRQQHSSRAATHPAHHHNHIHRDPAAEKSSSNKHSTSMQEPNIIRCSQLAWWYCWAGGPLLQLIVVVWDIQLALLLPSCLMVSWVCSLQWRSLALSTSQWLINGSPNGLDQLVLQGHQ